LEDVLGYSPSNFSELLYNEKKSEVGITGHTLIGAIHLTWYTKSSTRVFRDMRFLISPNAVCDLVIGARSIVKDNILPGAKILENNLS
jgi:hypothetical protein